MTNIFLRKSLDTYASITLRRYNTFVVSQLKSVIIILVSGCLLIVTWNNFSTVCGNYDKIDNGPGNYVLFSIDIVRVYSARSPICLRHASCVKMNYLYKINETLGVKFFSISNISNRE